MRSCIKGRALCLFLAVLLLSGTVYAADAGSEGDPLISLSYITNIFRPAVLAAADAKLQNDASRPSGGNTSPLTTISAGGSVRLSTGQTAILLIGSASLSVEYGGVVNCSAGAEVSNGALALRQRYLVCEDASASIYVTDDSTFVLSPGAVVTQGQGTASPFSDVLPGSWYYNDVVNACTRGLVNGVTLSTYEPKSTLTGAECVKLAACMHQLWHTGELSLQNDPFLWYRSYVDYALQNGILDGELGDYDAAMRRGELARIFYRALPESNYPAVNSITDGSIPDVGMDDEYAREIYAFYRAGILSGYTADGTHVQYAFDAPSSITRAEVAVILSRMFDPAVRMYFSIA